MFRGKKKEEPPESRFDVDLEHGTVTRKSDGARVVALDSLGWAILEKELISTFISGAAVILQRMGYSFGRNLGNVAKGKGRTPQQVLEVLEESARASGWGQLTLNGGDLYAGQAKIVVRGCFFCAHIRKSPEPVCHMLGGLIGGVADEMIGHTHRVVEEKCVGKGDNICEILVERID